MRRIMGSLALVGLGSLALAQTPGQAKLTLQPAGQNPPAAPATPPPNPQLDNLLAQWEAKMRSVTALEATVVRVNTNPKEKTSETYQGKAMFLRPDKASLFLKKVSNPDVYEHFIFTGTYLYDYHPQLKKLDIYEVANKPGQMVEDNFLNFLFGLKAEEAKRRYDLTLAKTDANYVYLYVKPKFSADRADFTEARLVLWANSFLPRQLEFETPNGEAVKWDIQQLNPAARFTGKEFQWWQPPKDWKIEKKPRAQPPAGVTPVAPQPSKVRPAGG